MSDGSKQSNCSTYAAHVFNASFDAGSVPTTTRPVRNPCVFLPLTTSNSVVFPAPDGPMSADTRPGGNAALTSRNSVARASFRDRSRTSYDTSWTTTGSDGFTDVRRRAIARSSVVTHTVVDADVVG